MWVCKKIETIIISLTKNSKANLPMTVLSNINTDIIVTLDFNIRELALKT